MDLNKSKDFFDPKNVRKMCHIIGCGSIGGNVAELLTRYGIKNITLWDEDIVMPHNLANQIFTSEDIGTYKTDALTKRLEAINPDINITKNGFYTNEILNGYVFLCLDNIDIRRTVVETNYSNLNIDSIYDFRTNLLEGQHYMADWSKNIERKSLLNSMDFRHEEVKTQVNACGFELGVSPVVRMISEAGICNFTNKVNGTPTKKLIIIRPYSFEYEAY